MKRLKLPYHIGFALLLCLLLSSCAYNSSLSLSSSQNVPLLTKQHDARIEVGTGTQNIGVQAAYAITNHLEVMGNLSFGQNLSPSDPHIGGRDFLQGPRIGGEFGMGYFSKIDTSIPFELLGGVERYYRAFMNGTFTSTDNITTNITKPFIQGDIGFNISKGVQIGLSCRFGYLLYDHYIDNINSGGDTTIKIKTRTITYNSNLPIIEPSITFRCGRRDFRFMFQYGLSITPYLAQKDNLDLFFNMGLSYTFTSTSN